MLMAARYLYLGSWQCDEGNWIWGKPLYCEDYGCNQGQGRLKTLLLLSHASP